MSEHIRSEILQPTFVILGGTPLYGLGSGTRRLKDRRLTRLSQLKMNLAF
jgi:hypothetical protein